MHPIILMAIVFVAWIGFSLAIGLAGRRRKLGGWGYFFASIMLTPLIGLLLLAASDVRPRSGNDD